jgi:hypothetical protein
MKISFLLITLIGTILSNDIYNIYDDKLLFCLDHSVEPLTIINNNKIIVTDVESINTLLEQYSVSDLEPWLNGVTEEDHDNKIYLNRIYRIVINKSGQDDLLDLKNQLEKLNIIHSVEFEYKRRPLYTPNDQYYNNQWFLPDINTNDAWNYWTNSGSIPGSRDVILASVDLGVNWQHPDLINNIWQNLNEDADGDGHTIEGSGSNWYLDPGDLNGIDDDDWDNNGSTYIDDLIGWDPSGINGVDDNDPDPPNSNGWSHGTHVAGLLASTTDNSTGIASTAFNCSIMSVKVSTENQQGDIYITDGFDGIIYASKAAYFSKGFSIINNSWGGVGYSQYEQSVINTCYNNYNTIIVCAGGNGSDTGWGESNDSHYPSGYENVVSVCPIGTNNSWNHWATYGSTIDLASPGESIRSCTGTNGYQSWDGSSMASPVAASVMGLLKSFNMDWNNEMVQTMVLETANPIIYTINSETYLQNMLGRGKVDAYAALSTPLFPKIEYSGDDIVILNDSDGVINPGESINLSVILFNNPNWGDATNVELTLSSPNTNVSISNPVMSIGDINSGDVGINIETPFNILFNNNIDDEEIEFILNIKSNEQDYIKYTHSISIILPVFETDVALGDINQDTIINILDVVQLVNIILNDSGLDNQILSADLNEDNLINIQDIILLLNLILTN